MSGHTGSAGGRHTRRPQNGDMPAGDLANHLVLVVVDGRREGYGEGVLLPEPAVVLPGLGCITAYDLDGGGSSTMLFHGGLVDDPLGEGTVRRQLPAAGSLHRA
ncbi:phosphodiester glycosidase family protein [Modestobacter excelsi]|uniref:phosphodiester glycosidase family protein n=1 Tax=Modestobacter excelsi TaxID=2213161 RepID=UPI00110D0685|nr:phosphodiester glycosidase family protein [Modestobacter excelsi]